MTSDGYTAFRSDCWAPPFARALSCNMNLGAYEIWESTASLPDPRWPELSLQELLRTAFKDRYIADLQHPVLQRLRGET